MKSINIIIFAIDNLLNFLISLIVIVVLFISFYALYDSVDTVEEAKLSKELKEYIPDTGEVDVKKLKKEINDEIVGWITIDNTSINYPVVHGTDNIKYLTYNYKNEYSSTGSLFLDYRNNKDFDDDYSIIYGHNINSNVMFGEIKRFEDEKFFNNHLTGTLYTENKNYEIEVYAFSVLDAYSNYYNINYYKNGHNKEIIDQFNRNSSNYSKLLLLSTCRTNKISSRSTLLLLLK